MEIFLMVPIYLQTYQARSQLLLINNYIITNSYLFLKLYQSNQRIMQNNPIKVQDQPYSDISKAFNDPKNLPQLLQFHHQQTLSINKDLFTENDLQNAVVNNTKKYWSQEEDKKLLALAQNTNFNWAQIAKNIEERTENMCYNRYRRLLMKSPSKNWRKEDEELLKNLVQRYGKKWKTISLYFPNRTPKQLRERYLNFLRDGINTSEWTAQEEIKVLNLIKLHGKKWKSFEKELPGRTQNQIKSRFYGKLYRIYEQKQKESS